MVEALNGYLLIKKGMIVNGFDQKQKSKQRKTKKKR